MPILETPAECRIRISGQEIKHLISRVELNQFDDDHHVLKVTIKQGGTLAKTDFDDPSVYTAFLGESIAVTITPTGGAIDSSKELEFIGIVSEVSLDNSIDGLNTVLVTAHSPTKALDGSKHNAFFHEQKSSDIIGAILRNYQITLGKVESTDKTLEFSVQYGETDYEYLMRLAYASGKFALYDGKEFKVTAPGSSDTEELVWRESLGVFSVGLGTQPMEFDSQIYNYRQKKTYSQDSKSLSQQASLSDLSKLSHDASGKVYSDTGFVEAPIVEDARSLDNILERERSQAMGRMIICKGESIIPKVSVGHCVSINGMPELLNRTYWVKSIKHVFDESGKYHNTFECTPLDMAFPKVMSRKRSLTHLQPAVVVDNNDPDKLGRIKIKFPWSSSDETPWARYLAMEAGKDRGWFWLPEIDDEVLVGFEYGNPNMPIVLGSLYNKDDSPISQAASDKNLVKMLTTKSGNQILFNDESGKEEIQISMKDGKNQLILSLDGPKITLKSDGGDISIQGKNISIESDEKITLKTGSNLELNSGADLQMEASGNFKSKATGNFDAEGAMVNVKGNPINLN